MTFLIWDAENEMAWGAAGTRLYEAGIDRGVLYLSDGSGVAWNGLTSVQETLDDETVGQYLDGVKYLDREVLGEFGAKLQAFTYPDEFEQFIGVSEAGNGLFIHDQKPKSFGMSYRTRIGNDVDGVDHGYKIHILYNLMAVEDDTSYESLSSEVAPVEFSWALQATPVALEGFRPTAHVIIDSTEIEPSVLVALEEALYGTLTTEAYLPSLQSLSDLSLYAGQITITDNGDGTWTATGPDRLVELLDPTTLQIEEVDATYLDADTYTITTTVL